MEEIHIETAIVKAADARMATRLIEQYRHSDERPSFSSIVVFVAQFSGDTQLLLDHAELAMKSDWATPAAISGLMAEALAHQGRAAEAREQLKASLREPGYAALVEAAEVELVLGDIGAAREFLLAADQEGMGDVLARAGWWRAAMEVMTTNTELERDFAVTLHNLAEQPAPSVGDIFVKRAAEVAHARLLLRRGNHEGAIARCQPILEESQRFGMDGVALEALVVLTEAMQVTGDPIWTRTVSTAVALADRLGRTVVADQLRKASAG